MKKPRRGEVWWADLEPTRGAELRKTRPVVVISTEDAGVLPIKVVAPVTAWSPGKKNHLWLVRVRPTGQNGLRKESCVDVMQVRGLSVARFADRVGALNADDLDEVVTALALVVGYEGERG
jgi:mRNA interferase MazF